MRRMVLAICIATLAVAPGVQALAQAPVRSKGKVRKTVTARPYTIDRLLVGLQDVKNGDYTEPALVKQVAKDGVAFASLPENLDRLRKAGASSALIEAVLKIAPAPPPEPPPVIQPKPKGDLEFSCTPAECEVSIGGTAIKTTLKGKLHVAGLAEGETSVHVSKNGFTSSETRVRIASEKAASLHVELNPTRATLEIWGEQLRNRAVDALGGEPALVSMGEIFALGDCTVWGQDGKPYQSSIEALMRGSAKAFFRMRAGKSGSYEVEYLPVFQSKTNFPEQEARALDAGLRLLADFQVAKLLARMKQPGMTIVADGVIPANLDGAVFHAESSTDAFTVLLNADGRPKRIEQTNTLGKGARAEYSDYKLQSGSFVPARMMVVWQGSPQQGISVHFSTVELKPDATRDLLYSVKKRRRLW